MTTPTTAVYSKPSCVQCSATYRALNNAGIEYQIIEITQDPDALALATKPTTP